MIVTQKQLSDIIKNNPNVKPEDIVKGVISRGWTIEGQQKPSILQNIGREIAKPFVQGAELLGQAGQSFGATIKAGGQALSGNQVGANQTILNEANRLQESRKKSIPLLGGQINRITTPNQAIGSALNLASNFVGGGGAVKAGGVALKTGLKSAIKTGVKAGAKAGTLYGAGEAISNNQNPLIGAAEGAITGGLVGGALPAAGSAIVGTAKAIASPFTTAIEKLVPTLDKIANKVETVITKPSKTDIAHGFKVENVFKYDLGGSLGQSLEKTQFAIDQLVTRAESLREKSKSVINLNNIINDTAKEISNGKISTVGNNSKILKAFKTWVSELEDVAPSGKINSIEAQKIKVALGKMGSWLNGQRDLDSTAMENVSNIMYTKFKTAIENAVDDPKELREINKQLSELIPINSVLIKRIPIAERNSAISLTDILSAGAGTINPKAWGVFAVNRLSKSGRFANLVSKSSQKLRAGAKKLLPLESKAKKLIPEK